MKIILTILITISAVIGIAVAFGDVEVVLITVICIFSLLSIVAAQVTYALNKIPVQVKEYSKVEVLQYLLIGMLLISVLTYKFYCLPTY